MAASVPPPPPPPMPTTITALGDDLLREIFLRLPDVTSLARAAFACHAFLGAVRSSPAFRRRFRQLRAPPLLALFLQPQFRAIVPADAGKGSGIRGFTCLLQDSDASDSEWQTHPQIHYSGGCANFVNRATDQLACYSPHSQAPKIDDVALLEFHTLSPDGEEQRPSRVVCVHRDGAWAWVRVAVFSSHTMEWQVVLPEMQTGTPLPAESDRCPAVTVAGGFVCWVHDGVGCIFMLDTATFQLSRMDLPPAIEHFQLGQTKDGELCLVSLMKFMLSVWLWAADDDGVQRFMLHKMFSLRANVSKITECAEEDDVLMRSLVVINGFVYLSVIYRRNPPSPVWFLSCCLETDEMNVLHKEGQVFPCIADPYLMVSWPSSLINGKEDSETVVTGNICEDDGSIGTEEASPLLLTALQSFKEKLLIDDGNLRDRFLLT